jgi:sugar lactone lactonase YvrE
MAIDRQDQIFVVDMTGRIQVFDRQGQYLRGWRTPEIASGRPTGLGIANDGSLMVADTHYFRVLFYTPEGQLQADRTIGGAYGTAPAEFHFVTDVVQAPSGRILAGQYGELDQIQEFTDQGRFVRRWGQQGSQLDCFARPQTLLIDPQGLLWVADACNHRILQFELESASPKLVRHFGSPGDQPGQLRYPYGLAWAKDGTLLVAEFGNHRVQRFSTAGESLEIWGAPGSGPGQFSSPWALAVDSTGAIHVLDTLNHRVQRFPA